MLSNVSAHLFWAAKPEGSQNLSGFESNPPKRRLSIIHPFIEPVFSAKLKSTLSKRIDENGYQLSPTPFIDLVEAGKMDQEDYDRFASIEDPDERRQAIAQWIQEQLDNGNLTLEDLEGHPWVEEWLDLREQKENAVQYEGQQASKEKSDLTNTSQRAKRGR